MRQAISRREFLKYGPSLLAAGYLSLREMMAQVAKSAVGYSGLTDLILDTIDKVDDLRHEEGNPGYRPMKQILDDGIRDYEQSTRQRAFFEREPDYRDSKYYADAVGRKVHSRVTISGPREFESDLKSAAPGEANSVLSESFLRLSQSEAIMTRGSGFLIRFQSQHPELFRDGKILDYTKYFELSKAAATWEISSASEFLEQERSLAKKQVSTSRLLSYFLEKNSGNIGLGIADTYLFLKFKRDGEKDDDWFCRHIKDEFMGLNFNNLPPGEERLNQTGKPYHSWNFLNLLRYFPVEVVRLGGISKQLLFIQEQGVDKVVADATTLEELSSIEKYLLTFSSGS